MTCCARELDRTYFYDKGYGLHPYRQEQARPGQRWKCPKCGKLWVHDCDEAEGCAWYPALKENRK